MPFKPTFSFKKLRSKITDLDSKAVTAYRFRTLKGYLDDVARIDFDHVLRDAENVECFAGWDLSSVWSTLPKQRLQKFLTILELKMNVTKGGEQDAIWQSFLRILYTYCPDAAFGIALESESRGRRYQELVNKGLNKKEIGLPCNFKHVAGSKLQQTSSCLDLTSRAQVNMQRPRRPSLRHQNSSSIEENPYAEPHQVTPTPVRLGPSRSFDLDRKSLPPPPALPPLSLTVPANVPFTTPSPLPSPPPPPPMGDEDSLPPPPGTPPSPHFTNQDELLEERFSFTPINNVDPGHYRSYTPLPSPPPNPDQDTPIYSHSLDLPNGIVEPAALYVPPPPTDFMSDFYGNFDDATFVSEVDQFVMGTGSRNQNGGEARDPRATFAPLAKAGELSTRL